MGAQGIGEAFEGMLKVGQALLIIVLILSGLLCMGIPTAYWVGAGMPAPCTCQLPGGE